VCMQSNHVKNNGSICLKNLITRWNRRLKIPNKHLHYNLMRVISLQSLKVGLESLNVELQLLAQ